MKKNAVVVMASCHKNKKPFAIRSEKRGSIWYFTWAFVLTEVAIKSEGFDRTEIRGEINIDPEYPGCPHCGARTFFQCGSCKRIVCLCGDEKVVKCPVCGNGGELAYVDKFDHIKGGEY